MSSRTAVSSRSPRRANSCEKKFLTALDSWQHPVDGSQWHDATPGFRLQAWSGGKLKIDVACGETSEIYDWASLTKIVQSVSNAMIEVDEGDLSLRDKLVDWIPEISCQMSERELIRIGKPLTVRDLLSHSAGMTWWKPFYKSVAARSPCDHEEAWAVLCELVIRDVRRRIKNGEIAEARRGPAVYSDLDFFLLGEILRRSSLLSIPEQYARVQDRFGLSNTFFHALSRRDVATHGHVITQGRGDARGATHGRADIRGPTGSHGTTHGHVRTSSSSAGIVWHRDRRDSTAPTEHDRDWRSRILKSEVHDENTTSLFGIAPHAGLFGPIGDLSRYGLELRKLSLGLRSKFPSSGTQFLRRSVSRTRGDWALGFMMPTKGSASCGPYFSASSVGHTGFTGTSLWFDPRNDLLVTILSNRVHPTRKNTRFLKLRPALHTFAFSSIF